MSNMNNMRRVWEYMTPGEKQYMANKLWKEDLVVATKLREYIPEEVLNPPIEYNEGDLVTLTEDTSAFLLGFGEGLKGELCVYVGRDKQDTAYPHQVQRGNGNTLFTRPKGIKPFQGEFTGGYIAGGH